MKILIVDNNKKSLTLLDTLLRGNGFQVEQARNGRDALIKLKNSSCRMVISDVLMPVMDGYELCRICKNDPVLKKIIFIFYTAICVDKEDEKFSISLGADLFLIKPMEPDVFLSAVRDISKKTRKENIPKKEPEITDAEAIKKHRDKLMIKLGKKVDELKSEITKRKQSEKAISESEDRFRRIFEDSPIGMAVSNTSYRFVRANPSFCKMLGYTEKEILSLSFKEITHPNYLTHDIENIRKLASGKISIYKTEKRYVKKNGEILWGHLTLSKILDEKGNLACYLVMLLNLTERKQAEDLLREREEFIRSIVETSREWIWAIDKDGNHMFNNPAIENILGYKPDELTGKSSIHMIHEEDRKFVESQLPKWIAGKKGWENLILRWKHKDGSWRWLESNSVPIINADGELTGFRGVDRDITERRLAEETILKERTLLRTLIDNLPNAVFVKDQNYRKIIANPVHLSEVRGHLKYLGKNPDIDILNKTDFEVFPKKLAEKFYKDDQKVIKNGQAIINSIEFGVQPDGKIIWLMVSKVPLRDKNGSITGMVGITHNFTKQKLDEEAIRSANERLRILHHITETLHQTLDPDVLFKRITDAVVKSLGFSTALVLILDEKGENFHVRSLSSSKSIINGINQILGFSLKKLVIPFSDIIEAAKNSSSTTEIITSPHLSGIAHPPLDKSVCDALEKLGGNKNFILIPLILSGKPIGGMIVTSASEQIPETDSEVLSTFAGTAVQAIANADLLAKTNEAKQQIQNNLEEKEILLRELYHRTKNNMQVISAMLRLRARVVNDPYISDAFQEIENKILSMALVHQKLYESKNLSLLNLKDYFDSLISLIKDSYYELMDRIIIHSKMEDVHVLIDTAIPMGLIINELLTNAVKYAFPDKRSGEIKVNLHLTPKNALIIEISDNGVGLPDNFDFQKDIHLGLQTVFDLVESQLGGKIKLKNRDGLYCRLTFAKELYQPRV